MTTFEEYPHHGYFLKEDKKELQYTIMATGDDVELEDGNSDRGLGRIFYFSSPRLQNGLVLGDSNNDNAHKITISRDIIIRIFQLMQQKILMGFILNISVQFFQICLCKRG